MNVRVTAALVLILLGATILYLQNVELPTKTPKPKHISETELLKSFLQKRLDASEAVYQEYVRKRREFVGSDPANVVPWPPDMVMYYWDYFLPTFSCPYTTQRVGSFGDGGKWVCGMELFEKDQDKETDRPCVIYSFGVASESSFEAEFLARTNCMIYAYDASVGRMGPQVSTSHPRVKFFKRFITAEGNSSLGALMKENGHRWIDFLKMDIEGGELDVLNAIVDDFEILPFAQLMLEVHGDNKGSTFASVYKLWERLESKGLRAFNNEINHWPCVRAHLNPIYDEYSFINIKGPSRLLP